MSKVPLVKLFCCLYIGVGLLAYIAGAQKTGDFFRLQGSLLGPAEQKDTVVEWNVYGKEPFYVGGNTYFLKIGDAVVGNCRQINIDGRGFLKFSMPLSELQAVHTGDSIFVFWGHPEEYNRNRKLADSRGARKYLALFAFDLIK